MRRPALIGLLPLALYLGGFTLLPVASTLALSLTARGGGITLEHFRRIAGHYQFNQAAVNTLAITGIGLTLELGLGLAAALALTGRPILLAMILIAVGTYLTLAGPEEVLR